MVHSPARLIPSHAWLPVMVYWVSALIGTIQSKCQVPAPRLPQQTRPLDKSKQNASVTHTDTDMLGWNEEVQWRGEGPRAEFHGAAAALRTSAHGAGESWKNFILQTQGIAGTVSPRLASRPKGKYFESVCEVVCLRPAPLCVESREHLGNAVLSFSAGAPQHLFLSGASNCQPV